MFITRKTYFSVCAISGLILLSGCHKQGSRADQIKAKSVGQLVGGSVAGAAATAGTAMGITGLTHVFFGTGWTILGGMCYAAIGLPIIALFAPIAGILLTKGIKNHKEAKRLKKLEEAKQKKLSLAQAPKDMQTEMDANTVEPIWANACKEQKYDGADFCKSTFSC